jgi:hypothetical protein
MSNEVQFDDENSMNYSNSFRQNSGPRPGVFEGLLIKTGLVKNVTQANYVLIGLIVLCITLTIFIFFKSLSGPKQAPIDKAAMDKMIQRMSNPSTR